MIHEVPLWITLTGFGSWFLSGFGLGGVLVHKLWERHTGHELDQTESEVPETDH